MTPSTLRWPALVAAALLAACGGTAPREQYYTLSGPDTPLPAATAAGPSILVLVTVPEGVDRSPMVLRTGPNQVDVTDFHRWAEPLKHAIPRVVAEHLAREVGTPRVFAGRAAAGQAVDLRVAIDVQRFESSLQQGAILDALWTVSGAKATTARTRRSLLVEPAPSPDPAGLAAAHSRALARLAGEIAKTVRGTEP